MCDASPASPRQQQKCQQAKTKMPIILAIVGSPARVKQAAAAAALVSISVLAHHLPASLSRLLADSALPQSKETAAVFGRYLCVCSVARPLSTLRAHWRQVSCLPLLLACKVAKAVSQSHLGKACCAREKTSPKPPIEYFHRNITRCVPKNIVLRAATVCCF